MFSAIHQHLKQYLIQNLSTHSCREVSITMIALQCTELHFLSKFEHLSNTSQTPLKPKNKNDALIGARYIL